MIVKYGVVKLLQKTFDLCEQAKEINKECPLQEGEFGFIKDVDLPREIPPVRPSLTLLCRLLVLIAAAVSR